jgi:histidinol-phosphate aminotransferase
VNQLTQDVALQSLLNQEKVKNNITAIISERNQLIRDLENVEIVEKVYSSDANFLLVQVDDANLRYKQLVKLGIIVRNRTTQILCDNCLRFTVGTPDENKKLINTLKLV